ncbi:DinB family protein [Neptunomonas marina]|uniref:Damage-inducible protein DinB n=1 Tax=Neptunomonas marina TaxID=1815562 RepID=A0A437QE48_9GAMM|nr:DinB family protein [Neptunomonas marina]RVU32776.1 damage-inducible protein DinB [Neptunomonas marina]
MQAHLQLLAQYNKHMNKQLFALAEQLTPEQRAEDRGAFFGSVMGTLNHILVGDLIWLSRLAEHPIQPAALGFLRSTELPTRLDQTLFSELHQLWQERQIVDSALEGLVEELSDTDLTYRLTYQNMQGMLACRETGALLLHLFNHQTHHRGQLTTLYSQFGLDVGVTDLLALIPSHA